ncbi:MAG TPA: hypothetical protein VM241_06445 [Candidatus Thermoplasmatota archaeon]|nr:hypothetical protein [Candidatus Thermoplasmatota archaeon]
MRRPSLALPALLAVLLPGCLFGSCDDRAPAVAFHDAGLFEAIPAAAGHGWRVAQAPAEGLPLHNAALEAALGHVAIAQVSGPSTGLGLPPLPRGSFGDDRLHMDGSRRVTVVLNDTAPPGAYRAATLAFLENVTAWDGGQRAVWADRFLATRVLFGEVVGFEDGTEVSGRWFGHALDLDAPLRLDQLAVRLLGAQGPRGTLAGDGWAVALEVPPRVADRDGLRFTVGTAGNHTFTGAWPQKDVGEAVALADYRSAYGLLGLDRPVPPAAYAFSGAIC